MQSALKVSREPQREVAVTITTATPSALRQTVGVDVDGLAIPETPLERTPPAIGLPNGYNFEPTESGLEVATTKIVPCRQTFVLQVLEEVPGASIEEAGAVADFFETKIAPLGLKGRGVHFLSTEEMETVHRILDIIMPDDVGETPETMPAAGTAHAIANELYGHGCIIVHSQWKNECGIVVYAYPAN